MLEKSFDFAIEFERRSNDWYPIVRTVFIRNDGYQFRLPLLLDTGSDILVLHKRFEPMFNNVVPRKFKGLGGKEYEGTEVIGTIELFGRKLDCTIGFAEFEFLSWRAGFLGRECLETFGLGYWQSAREFYVSLTPED